MVLFSVGCASLQCAAGPWLRREAPIPMAIFVNFRSHVSLTFTPVCVLWSMFVLWCIVRRPCKRPVSGLYVRGNCFLGPRTRFFCDDNCHAVIVFVVTVPFVFARNSFLSNLNEASLSCLPGKKIFYDSDDCLQISTVTLLSTCPQYMSSEASLIAFIVALWLADRHVLIRHELTIKYTVLRLMSQCDVSMKWT